VAQLRIRFLTERASAGGFEKLARRAQIEWHAVSQAMGIREDYHGFYDHRLEGVVDRTIRDMLDEVNPRPYTEDEARAGGWGMEVDTPVRLLNWAWQAYTADKDGYASWEGQQIGLFLGRDTSPDR
jgi:hypothetical protein